LLDLTPCFPFRVSFDPEDLRIEGNPFRVNPSPPCGSTSLTVLSLSKDAEGDKGGRGLDDPSQTVSEIRAEKLLILSLNSITWD
jgi:hypothetical protein